MKKTFKFMVAAFASLAIVSCEDIEPTIYNGEEGQDTFLSFSSSVYTLPVIIDETGNVVITLNSSTVSSVDRTYNLDVIEQESTAPTSVYTMPSTITIPAGSYQGTITVEGTDDGDLVDLTADPVVVELTGTNGEFTDSARFTINVVQVCPLSDDFTGEYIVTQLTPPLNLTGGGSALGEGTVVELVQVSEYERSFSAAPYPNATSAPEIDVNFTLTCGETSLATEVDTGIGCTAGNTIKWALGTTSAQYAEDGSVIEITFTEEATSSCSTPRQTTIRLTRVN